MSSIEECVRRGQDQYINKLKEIVNDPQLINNAAEAISLAIQPIIQSIHTNAPPTSEKPIELRFHLGCAANLVHTDLKAYWNACTHVINHLGLQDFDDIQHACHQIFIENVASRLDTILCKKTSETPYTYQIKKVSISMDTSFKLQSLFVSIFAKSENNKTFGAIRTPLHYKLSDLYPDTSDEQGRAMAHAFIQSEELTKTEIIGKDNGN